jgi:hypothetical protein
MGDPLTVEQVREALVAFNCGITTKRHRAILRRLLDSGFLEASMKYFAFYSGLPDSFLEDGPYGEEWGDAAIRYRRLMAQPTEGDHAER